MRLHSLMTHRGLACLVLAFAVTACGGGDGDGQADEIAAVYPHTSAKNAWEAANIRDYEFNLQRSCFCPPPAASGWQVTVRDGQVVRALDGDTPVDAQALGGIPTISQLYRMMDAVSASGQGSVGFAVSGSMGQLTSVYLDYVLTSADEEVGYQIPFFRPI